MITTHLRITGMLSVHSVRAVFTTLSAIEGIARAEVTMGRAVVEHDGHVTCERLREALALVGCEIIECREERRTLPLLQDGRG